MYISNTYRTSIEHLSIIYWLSTTRSIVVSRRESRSERNLLSVCVSAGITEHISSICRASIDNLSNAYRSYIGCPILGASHCPGGNREAKSICVAASTIQVGGIGHGAYHTNPPPSHIRCALCTYVCQYICTISSTDCGDHAVKAWNASIWKKLPVK